MGTATLPIGLEFLDKGFGIVKALAQTAHDVIKNGNVEIIELFFASLQHHIIVSFCQNHTDDYSKSIFGIAAWKNMEESKHPGIKLEVFELVNKVVDMKELEMALLYVEYASGGDKETFFNCAEVGSNDVA